MSIQVVNRLRAFAAASTILLLAPGVVALAQSGTTVRKVKQKVDQAGAPAAAQQAPARQTPAPAAPQA